jgi:tetratricopeptide (TPR) repeat protein
LPGLPLELASHITQQPVFDLAEPLSELEQRSIFVGQRFSHDLIFETALASISAPVRVYLHKQMAEYLEKQQGNPNVIAFHYLNASNHKDALPHMIAASDRSFQLGDLSEAIKILEKAIVYETHLRSRALTALAVRYMMANRITDAERISIEALESQDDVARTSAYRVLVEIRLEQGRFEESLDLIKNGMVLAEQYDKDQIASFQMCEAHIAFRTGDFIKSASLLEEVRQYYSLANNQADYLSIVMSLAVVYKRIKDQFEKAKMFEKEAYKLAKELKSDLHLIQLASNYLIDCINRRYRE